MDASTFSRMHTSLDSIPLTPRSHSSCIFGINPSSPSENSQYTKIGENVHLEHVGIELKSRICEVCHRTFANDFMTKCSYLDQFKKYHIIDQIINEFWPKRGSVEVP